MQQPPPYPGTGEQQQGWSNSAYSQAYPPQQAGGYPPQPGGFSSESAGYPPQPGGFPPQSTGYPPQPGGFQPQPTGYPSQQGGFPPQGPMMGANMAAATVIKEQSNYNHVGSDEPNSDIGGFGEKAVRRGFIRKVYSILMSQLVLTGAVIATFMFVDPVKAYVQTNMWVYYSSMAVMFVCLISMACCESVRRKFPTNFIFLGVFTLCEGVMLGTLSTFYDVDAVLIAVGITAGVTFALTIFAFQTKIDFTVCGGMLCAVLVIFMIAGIIMAFLPKTKWTMIGYGSVGALIFSLYIVYDTQLMMGGKHKYSLSPEEYIFAALNLYLDIINLFMYLLMIVGAARSD